MGSMAASVPINIRIGKPGSLFDVEFVPLEAGASVKLCEKRCGSFPVASRSTPAMLSGGLDLPHECCVANLPNCFPES